MPNKQKKERMLWETLRLITPVLLGLLTYQFLQFQKSLEENTAALGKLNMAVAIIQYRMDNEGRQAAFYNPMENYDGRCKINV